MFTTVPENETWLSTRQAARVLGISEWSLRRYANGSTWADAAAAVGIKAPCLRKWYRDRRAEEFIETLVRENLNVANNLLTSAAPRLADELIQIALDPKVKAYARTQAISESFKILRENVLEQEQRKQLREIRETLQSIEDGSKQAIDV